MKYAALLALIALSACASKKDTRGPSSEAEVTGKAKDVLCEAIEEMYGAKMWSTGKPKTLTCRDQGKFSLSEGEYRVVTPSTKGFLRCSAVIDSTGPSRSPVVRDLECVELERK